MNANPQRAPLRAPGARILKVRNAALLCGVCLMGMAGIGYADVREVYNCKFINGAGMKELMSARDYLVEQSAKVGLGDLEAFIWTPYKVSGYSGDFLWFSNHADLAAFGTAANTYTTSKEGQAVQARFDKIVECDTSVSMREQIYTGSEELNITPPALISSFACKLKHGQTMAHMRDLISHYGSVLDAGGAHKQFLAFMDVPMVSSTDNDLFVYEVHQNVPTWASRTQAMQSSAAGQMFGRHANQVLDCTSALWWGQRVVPPQ